jgi:hypothetical protein
MAVGVIVGVSVGVAVVVGRAVGVRVGLGGRMVGEAVEVAVGCFEKGRFEHPARDSRVDKTIGIVRKKSKFFLIMVSASPGLTG